MPSKSKKQRRFMAAVAYNPRFARRVGVPQSVGQEFHSEDRKMKKRKYAKGGGIKAIKRKVLDLNDPKLADPVDDLEYKSRVEELKKRIAKTKVLDLNDESLPSRRKPVGHSPTEPLAPPSFSADEILMRSIPRDPAGRSQLQTQLHQIIMEQPNTATKLRALQRMNEVMGDMNRVTDQDLIQYMQSMDTSAFAKGGAVDRLAKLMAKQAGDKPIGGPPAKPPGPLFVDSYGQAYNTPDELIVGIREAIEDESDEPRWTDAAAMLKKLPGTEPAQQALATLVQAYDNPQADFDAALHAWTQALDSISKPQQAAPPQGLAKGGAVKDLRIPPKSPPSKQPPPKKPKSEEEKGRELKLATFAKGGKVKKVLGRIKKAMQPQRATVRHQVVVDNTQGDSVDGMVTGDLGEALNRHNLGRKFKVKKEKLVDRVNDEDFIDVDISGPRDDMRKFRDWQKKEGL